MSLAGFSSASINFALNAPAVGTAFPLQVDSNNITWQSSQTFRNRIINGDMRIAQYGNVALTNNTIKYGGCDRTFVVATGFTTATGTALQSTFSGSTSGKGQFAGTLTTTGTGKVFFVQRIESQNVNDLNSQSVTFSGKIAHDIGTTQSVIVRVTKANALDNFATVTLISQQTISVPSGVTTSFTLTALLGATDANNGLGLEIEFNLGAVSNKNIGVSDLQLEAGPTATPFERRPIGVELQMCQRYLPVMNTGGVSGRVLALGQAVNTTTAIIVFPFSVTPRVTPTSIQGAVTASSYSVSSATGGNIIAASVNYVAATNLSVGIINVGVASGLVAGNATYMFGDANIYWLGCEL